MKICLAQYKSITGDIAANIEKHLKFIDYSLEHGTEFILFPELSLTGYEPELAKALAVDPADSRLDVFQEWSDRENITIATGVPTKAGENIYITLVVFQPNKNRQTYSKKYLHADEEPFFVSGGSNVESGRELALSICYELSVPQHAEDAFNSGAKIYLSSVAKFAKGVVSAHERLAEIAKQYHMQVLMTNAVGPADNGICAGGTAVWDDNGKLFYQLNDQEEGILVYDTIATQVIAEYIQ